MKNKMTRHIVMGFLFITIFTLSKSDAAIHDYLAFEEHETIDFKAEVAAQSSSYEDIKNLAEEAVTVSYQFYLPIYSEKIDREMNRLRGYDAISSAPYKLALLTQTNEFANAIVNQIKIPVIKLSYKDRQVFWDISGEQIQTQMKDFLIAKSPYSPDFIMGELHNLRIYIDNLINLQKQF